MEVPKYITGITKGQLESMLRAGNIKCGRGIKIQPLDDGLEISIDPDSLKPILWSYIQNATTASNTVSLSDVMGVQIDPS